MNHLLITLLTGSLLLTTQPTRASSQSTSAHSLFKTIIESRKSEIIAQANKKLQSKDFHKGVFFPGDIPKIEPFSDQLARLKPRLMASPQGFIIAIHQTQIHLEIVDILTGRIRVAGKEVQLKKGMSYLQVAQTLARPIYDHLTIQKQSSRSPLDLFIPQAYGDDEAFKVVENDIQKLLGVTTGSLGYIAVSLGTVLLLVEKIVTGGLALTVSGSIILAALAALLGTAALGLIGHQLTMLLSEKDNKTIEAVKQYFDGMLYSCRRKKDLYYKNGQVKSGLDSGDFKDFQQLWLISKRFRTRWDGEKKLSCHQLTEVKGLDYYADRYPFWDIFYNAPSRYIFQQRIAPLCETYKAIVNCFADAPSPFGETVDTDNLSIHDELRGNNFSDFFHSLQEGLNIHEVLR